jgi:hypothetical protein
MYSQGWIKLHRQLLNSHVFQNEKLLKIWVWCLLKASHTERTQVVGRQKVELKEGQFVTGRHAAAAELAMAPSTAWDYLKLLESENCINIKSNNKFSVVTIVNWGFYQSQDEKSDSKSDNKSTANEQQMDTIKNVNNDKKNKDDIASQKQKKRTQRTKSLVNTGVRSGEFIEKTDETDEIENADEVIKNGKDAVKYFAEKFQEKLGIKYSANWAKEAKLMKDLLQTYGPEMLKEMIDLFLSENDDWVEQAGFTIGIFKTQANKLAIKLREHPSGDQFENTTCVKPTYVSIIDYLFEEEEER